ncbi:Uma2 family endonuclease [Thiocapsa roseopersicina]|uniref:Endonuclease, Uma2 family (Restriction endonuclease fold) n=1 Tax=Thiocapsa roseopersicina TaxID=1058 RepID=A0A1H2QRG3_THIRO|nr:Uma2 family endonuclease [Thiocapsa roseopersicina]SDW09796.1 Endonuclease, Uma2 family (restriction endonuclease fold) [Thiocapsa roseopersicina]
MPRAVPKTGSFNYGDYCLWPEDERWELIDGEAFAMAPAPTRLHQEFVVELVAQIHPKLAGSGCRVYVAPFDVRLPKNDEADARVETVVQPDVAVICDSHKLDAKGCRGAPDWIVEILSSSSAVHDQVRKRALYERHGVREYWLLHPIDRVLTIYRLGADGAYGKPDVQGLEGQTPVGVIDGLEICWPDTSRRIRT